MTDKHLKDFFKQPQKQMQLINTQQVVFVIMIAVLVMMIVLVMILVLVVIIVVLVRIIMWRMKMTLVMIAFVSQCCPEIDKVAPKVRLKL